MFLSRAVLKLGIQPPNALFPRPLDSAIRSHEFQPNVVPDNTDNTDNTGELHGFMKERATLPTLPGPFVRSSVRVRFVLEKGTGRAGSVATLRPPRLRRARARLHVCTPPKPTRPLLPSVDTLCRSVALFRVLDGPHNAEDRSRLCSRRAPLHLQAGTSSLQLRLYTTSSCLQPQHSSARLPRPPCTRVVGYCYPDSQTRIPTTHC